ncbi:MAG: hypothetical protein GY851_01200, partial [bacterium]|nr:hypothetical protein [bacterium]
METTIQAQTQTLDTVAENPPTPLSNVADQANEDAEIVPAAVSGEAPAEEEQASVVVPAREGALPGYPGPDVPDALCHTVSGIVYDPAGTPLPLARVWAARSGHGARDNRETVSNEDGRFDLRVPDGQWALCAAKGTLGGEADTDSRGEFVVEGPSQTVRTDIQTQDRSLLRGRIFDKATGKPIPHAKVWTDTRVGVTADAGGRFVIEGIHQHIHTLVALCPGYKRANVRYSTALRKETELEMFLERGGEITGVVTDENSHAIAHAWVRIAKSGSTQWLQAYYEVCDEQGRFEYEGVPLDD